MSLSQKAAYLKGLADGMELDAGSKEGKLLKAIIEVINDIAESVEEVEDCTAGIESELDEIAEELLSIEHAIEDDDEDDFECDCDECGEYFYNVTCPSCGDEIALDEDIIAMGSINCPNCNEVLEFEMEDDESGEDE